MAEHIDDPLNYKLVKEGRFIYGKSNTFTDIAISLTFTLYPICIADGNHWERIQKQIHFRYIPSG